MSRHCKDIVIRKMATARGNTQFSVTLPDEAIELLEKLKPTGLYGTNRAEIARTLILDMLKQLRSQKVV